MFIRMGFLKRPSSDGIGIFSFHNRHEEDDLRGIQFRGFGGEVYGF